MPEDELTMGERRRPGGAARAGGGVCAGPRPVVHLELRTGDLPLASAFYSGLLNWRPEWVTTRAGSYFAVGTGCAVGAGIVQCATERPMWVPYVEVERIDVATAAAQRLGGTVALTPREGPAGWRSVVRAPDGGELALWQSKAWR